MPAPKKPKTNSSKDYPRNNRGRQQDTTRINERIRAPKVRVVLDSGEQLGVLNTRDALDKARSLGMDLVEVAASADPPVCRIIDYGRYKYQQSKLQKTNKSKVSRMKEIKFRVGTGIHDYTIKMARTEGFLAAGHKVRIQLQFRGRENAHHELGFEIMNRVIADMKTMASVDQAPRLAGRAIGMALTPLPEAQRVRKFKAHLDDDFDADSDEFEDTAHENEGSEADKEASVSDEASILTPETPDAE